MTEAEARALIEGQRIEHISLYLETITGEVRVSGRIVLANGVALDLCGEPAYIELPPEDD